MGNFRLKIPDFFLLRKSGKIEIKIIAVYDDIRGFMISMNIGFLFGGPPWRIANSPGGFF
jgi:hypothetical protein